MCVYTQTGIHTYIYTHSLLASTAAALAAAHKPASADVNGKIAPARDP